MTNTSELKALMARNEMTIEQLAKRIGISATSLSYKINNKREFYASEIDAIKLELNLTNEERDRCFFNRNVD